MSITVKLALVSIFVGLAVPALNGSVGDDDVDLVAALIKCLDLALQSNDSVAQNEASCSSSTR